MNQDKLQNWLRRRRFPPKVQVQFFIKVKRLSDAGMPIKHIAIQLKNYGTKLEQEIAQAVVLQVGKGKMFCDGIQPWVSDLVYQGLRAGETVGSFSKGLDDAINAIETQEGVSKQLFGKLKVPFLWLAGIFAAIGLAFTEVFPILDQLLPRSQWGILGKLAYRQSEFWYSNGLLLLVGILICIAGIWFTMKTWIGESRGLADNLIGFRQYRLIRTTHFLRSIGHRLLAKGTLKQSLSSYKADSDKYVTFHIDKMLENIAKGKSNVGVALATGLLNEEEESTLKVLGQLGDPGPALINSAHLHQFALESEAEKLHKNAVGWCIVIALLVLGSFLGGIASIIIKIIFNF
ncbi:membrane hypothetical protein [Vibrio nigripulchritudo FTn2]|uniref:hypothetical protein n=1 Tax=Vibrio nigripulchritudo TaxID=28173 RepID=UPI0003B23BAE|nr:hypothetical protein [Vibrio nigripulchritudo]CCN39734.1 membrane hypothetical protein [Vibrio nigripulchritudo FTn2]